MYAFEYFFALSCASSSERTKDKQGISGNQKKETYSTKIFEKGKSLIYKSTTLLMWAAIKNFVHVYKIGKCIPKCFSVFQDNFKVSI